MALHRNNLKGKIS